MIAYCTFVCTYGPHMYELNCSCILKIRNYVKSVYRTELIEEKDRINKLPGVKKEE